MSEISYNNLLLSCHEISSILKKIRGEKQRLCMNYFAVKVK